MAYGVCVVSTSSVEQSCRGTSFRKAGYVVHADRQKRVGAGQAATLKSDRIKNRCVFCDQSQAVTAKDSEQFRVRLCVCTTRWIGANAGGEETARPIRFIGAERMYEINIAAVPHA